VGKPQLIVQIDGLSYRRLLMAFDRGLMPGLRRLARGESHRLVSLYSGVPSTTPAVQAALMYGAEQAVPGFAYFDRGRGVPRHLLDPVTADDTQRRIADAGEPLLRRGAAYCDVYTGGATGGRFCVSAFAEPRRSLERGVWYRTRTLGGYLGAAVRMLYMFGVEVVREARLGTLPRGRHLPRRLHDLWERTLSCVALRDNSRLGARSDLRLGVHPVHINFLGYDKLAHQYGPESRPAMAALEGIDRAIHSLLGPARRAGAEVTVYSDHGQEATTPIKELAGAAFGEIVREATRAAARSLGLDVEERRGLGERGAGVGGSRAGAPLRDAISQNIGEHLLGLSASPARWGGLEAMAVESGPIAHVYLRRLIGESAADQTDWPRADEELPAAFARAFIQRAPCAAAVWRGASGALRVVTPNWEASGAEEAAALFRGDHPFAERVLADVDRLLEHDHAGDVVLFGAGFGLSAAGGRADDEPGDGGGGDGGRAEEDARRESGCGGCSFAGEAGSHGGTGAEETHAFVVAPRSMGVESRMFHVEHEVVGARAEARCAEGGADEGRSGGALDVRALRAMLLERMGRRERSDGAGGAFAGSDDGSEASAAEGERATGGAA